MKMCFRIMKSQLFTTIPGMLWIVTAIALFFYRLNKKSYNKIVAEIKERSRANV